MAPRTKFQKSGDFHVYILECCDGSFYTGYTGDLAKRIEQHSTGKGAKYTRSHLPVRLVWCKRYRYYRNAIREEDRIKRLSRRQKELLVGAAPSVYFSSAIECGEGIATSP